ncbi:hypothetical protein HJFPF1_04104 [Paramyrothecium foliicola]|nr:hypothetical protein HJFPF1_04104 [Paramyrothecium foliicola]
MAMAESPSTTAPYSHEATVAAITSYFTLVSRVHAHRWWSALSHPPPGGWPQIVHDDFAGDNRSHDVIDLMRNIPYFEHSDSLQIMPDITPTNYIDPKFLARSKETTEQMRAGGPYAKIPLPPHIMGLAGPAEAREYGSSVCVDVMRGIVIMDNSHDPQRPALGVTEDAKISPEDEQFFGTYHRAWRIATFFDACEERLKNLSWMPIMECVYQQEGEMIEDTRDPGDDEISPDERKRILYEAGWPNQEWDARRAGKEVRRFYGDLLVSEESDSDDE